MTSSIATAEATLQALKDLEAGWEVKKGYSQAFMPPLMVEEALGSLDIHRDAAIAVPGAGMGHMLYALAPETRGYAAKVTAIEVDADLARLGQRLFSWAAWEQGSLFSQKTPVGYDVILCHPPYGANTGAKAGRTWLKKLLDLPGASPSTRSEHLFLAWSFSVAKPGADVLFFAPKGLYASAPPEVKQYIDSFGAARELRELRLRFNYSSQKICLHCWRLPGQRIVQTRLLDL